MAARFWLLISFASASRAAWLHHGTGTCGNPADGSTNSAGTTEVVHTSIANKEACFALCLADSVCSVMSPPRVWYNPSSDDCGVYHVPVVVNGNSANSIGTDVSCGTNFNIYSSLTPERVALGGAVCGQACSANGDCAGGWCHNGKCQETCYNTVGTCGWSVTRFGT